MKSVAVSNTFFPEIIWISKALIKFHTMLLPEIGSFSMQIVNLPSWILLISLRLSIQPPQCLSERVGTRGETGELKWLLTWVNSVWRVPLSASLREKLCKQSQIQTYTLSPGDAARPFVRGATKEERSLHRYHSTVFYGCTLYRCWNCCLSSMYYMKVKTFKGQIIVILLYKLNVYTNICFYLILLKCDGMLWHSQCRRRICKKKV